MKIINGKTIAESLNQELKVKILKLQEEHNISPTLVVILVGENPASKIYVKNKKIKAKQIGINSIIKKLDASVSQEELLEIIHSYNKNEQIDGILVQLPIPSHINRDEIIDAIAYDKDVDGFHSKNIGLLALGRPNVIPCTPLGCLKLIKTETNISSKDVIILGRSNIVGKPLSLLLTNHNATVTLAHSNTKNLKQLCEDKDIIVAAVGSPMMVKEDWVKENAVIIDVAINQVKDQNNKTILVGDVDFSNVFPKVKAITPVPGGVGPMTIHCLLENTFRLTVLRRNLALN